MEKKVSETAAIISTTINTIISDELELLQRQSLPTKVRTMKNKEGKEELVLYVKQADRDYARYCTGWRPGGMM